MTTKPWLEIQQTHLEFWGRLAVPSVSLVNDPRVADQLLVELGPYEARLDRLWMTVSPQNLAGSTLSLDFLGGEASVQIWASGLYLSLRSSAETGPNVPLILPPDVLSDIITRIGATVESPADHRRFDSHTFTLSFHARLNGQEVDELLGGYVRQAPKVLGESAGAGVRYFFQPTDDSRGSWLVAEPSLTIVPNGLYVSCSIDLDGNRVGVAESAGVARKHLETIVNSPDFPVRIGHE